MTELYQEPNVCQEKIVRIIRIVVVVGCPVCQWEKKCANPNETILKLAVK